MKAKNHVQQSNGANYNISNSSEIGGSQKREHSPALKKILRIPDKGFLPNLLPNVNFYAGEH